MIMKKEKKRTKIVSITEVLYSVYDKSDNLLRSYTSREALLKGEDIRNNQNMYLSMKYGMLFKPYKDGPEIRVSKTSKRVEKEVPLYGQTLDWYLKSKAAVIEDLPGEEWKEIPGFPYQYCSNLGRFKFMKDGKTAKILERFLSNGSKERLYRHVTLLKYKTLDGEMYIDDRILVVSSRALCRTWYDDTLKLLFREGDKRVVDHIDNNPANENIKNLRILAGNSENMRAAVYEQGVKMGKPSKRCYAYNINTKEEREDESTKKLVRDIWGKENNGYFYNYYTYKLTTNSGWRVGYDIEEIKSR